MTDRSNKDMVGSVESVVSKDGTVIGYRQLGHGPGLILVHGGMMASQNFRQLALALSDTFTLYVPDRRGRGLSGPHGAGYGLNRECEDVQALVDRTGAPNIFGLSSGALVVLQTALLVPSIRRIALYEPPLPVEGTSPAAWAPRFDSELARGDLAGAMVTVMQGTADMWMTSLLPRLILVPFMRFAIKAQAAEVRGDELSLQTLIPTMHFDSQLVMALEGKLETFRSMRAEVLLLGGSRSRGYLKAALQALNGVLPKAKRVEFRGLGHLAADNGGQPQRVAQELRRFFAAKEER